MLFQANGQFDPSRLGHGYHLSPLNGQLDHFGSRPIDYSQTIQNWEIAFDKIFPISEDEFASRGQAIIKRLENDPTLANCLNGYYELLFLEKMSGDYGEMMETIFLEALKRSYGAAGHDNFLFMWPRGSLAGRVKIFCGSSHERLLAKMTAGNVVFLHLVAPTIGYSVCAQQRVAELLPPEFSAAGLIDRAAFLASQPTSLSRLVREEGEFHFHCPAVYRQLKDHTPYLYIGEKFGLRLNDAISFGIGSGSGGLSVLEA